MPKQCVFIIGCPRSGTSALSWGLAQHPALSTSAESDFLHDLFKGHLLWNVHQKCVARPDGGWLAKNEVSYEEFCRFIGIGFDQMFRSRNQNKIWIDATPGYTLIAPTLAKLFPDAAFLHIVRDGRSVANSMVNSGFDVDWAKNFKLACETWKFYVQKGLEFEREFPERVVRVNHADLVAEPERICRQLLDYIGVDFSERCVDFLTKKRVNSSFDNENGLNIRSVKEAGSLKLPSWANWPEARKKEFDGIAGDLLRHLWPDQVRS